MQVIKRFQKLEKVAFPFFISFLIVFVIVVTFFIMFFFFFIVVMLVVTLTFLLCRKYLKIVAYSRDHGGYKLLHCV